MDGNLAPCLTCGKPVYHRSGMCKDCRDNQKQKLKSRGVGKGD